MIGERDGVAGWDQTVFRYLLAVEMARSRRTGRPFLVVVVDAHGARRGAGSRGDGPEPGLTGLPGALAGCLRETDLVGWHRPGRAAAAVVTATPIDGSVTHLLAGKVVRGLQQALGSARARHLAVRVYAHDVSGRLTALRLASAMTGTSDARATRRLTAGRRAPPPVAAATAVRAAPR